VTAHRPGALERIAFLLDHWQAAAGKLADTEQRMTGVLDQLRLTELATSIPGLSPVGAAAILAETGDPRRFATARAAVVKHAGLAPREKLSGTFVGRTKLTGQGRPGPRLTAWRAGWGTQRANPVYAAGYQHLTTREHEKPTPTQAQTVIAMQRQTTDEAPTKGLTQTTYADVRMPDAATTGCLPSLPKRVRPRFGGSGKPSRR
jgi:transposase